MDVTTTRLPGVLLLRPKVYADARGHFLESWNRDRSAGHGLPEAFVQDNVSVSHRGVVRGLHYQNPRGQGKLITVLHGTVYDVALDLRVGSPTFGRWEGFVLRGEQPRQLYIPPGFAHGFAALSDSAVFSYKCTEFYRPADEGAVRWDDPDLGIVWPVESPTLSAKDAAAPRLRDIPLDRLPAFESLRGSLADAA